MSDFNSDGGRGNVNPVYLSIKGTPLLQIFPTNYTEKNHCTMLGSPSESGLKMFDNKVRQPSTVQFTGILKVAQKSAMTKLRVQIKKNQLADLLCTFQSKSGTIENMIIESVEEVGESNRYDAMEIRVSLTEYLEHNKQ